MQNYPTSFNPSAKIKFTIANVTQNGVERSRVQLKVYNVLDSEVATLVDEFNPAGSYEIEFDLISSLKDPASEVYLYQLKAGKFVQTQKMILLK